MPASLDKPAVIFLHIPKTAGSTLHQIIRRQYQPRHVYHVSSHADSLTRFQQLPPAHRTQIRVLMGHFEMGIDTFLPQSSTYFTILRQPQARAISYFSHVRRDADHYCHDLVTAERMGLETFIRSGADVMMDNGQTRMIASVLYDIPFGQCGPDVLETAKQNLRQRFAFVGLTERFDESLVLMRHHFGWRSLFYTRRNVSPQQDKGSLPETTLAAIRQANRLDTALYDFAETLLAEQIARLEPAFSQDLTTFRRKNRFWGRPFHYGDEIRLRLLGSSER